MMLFWLFAVVMILLALAFVLPALLGKGKQRDIDQDQQNIQIARERLAELQAEKDSGNITDEQFTQAQRELERALLNDVQQSEQKATASRHPAYRLIITLVLLVPAITILMYFQLGQPQAIDMRMAKSGSETTAEHGTADGMPSVDVMVAQLEQRLEQNPNDAQGWFLLGRSYMTMGRYQEASQALEKVHALVGDHPSVLLSYADALTMLNGGRLSGKPFELIKKALQMEPNNATGLWLAGMAYEEQGDYQQAIAHWQRLLPLLNDDPTSLSKVKGLIARAAEQSGQPVPEMETTQSSAEIRVSVSLSPDLQQKANANDIVFIFARAPQGPPMPLAVVRKKVSDLPIEVTLNDDMAMMPNLKLSGFQQVSVSARISKTGNAIAQSGDFESESQLVDVQPGQTATIHINKTVK